MNDSEIMSQVREYMQCNPETMLADLFDMAKEIAENTDTDLADVEGAILMYLAHRD